ncbi:hypothetical protein COOONC_06930 [Cooperia oncophora]
MLYNKLQCLRKVQPNYDYFKISHAGLKRASSDTATISERKHVYNIWRSAISRSRSCIVGNSCLMSKPRCTDWMLHGHSFVTYVRRKKRVDVGFTELLPAHISVLRYCGCSCAVSRLYSWRRTYVGLAVIAPAILEGWWASWFYLGAFFIFGVGYNLGVGPVAYFIPAELVPAEAAGVSLGVAVAVNWFCSMLSTLLYYPLNESFGGWSYLLFIVPTSFFLIILYFFLPETRFHYRAEPIEARLLVDLGPPNPYGTFQDEADDLF